MSHYKKEVLEDDLCVIVSPKGGKRRGWDGGGVGKRRAWIRGSSVKIGERDNRPPTLLQRLAPRCDAPSNDAVRLNEVDFEGMETISGVRQYEEGREKRLSSRAHTHAPSGLRISGSDRPSTTTPVLRVGCKFHIWRQRRYERQERQQIARTDGTKEQQRLATAVGSRPRGRTQHEHQHEIAPPGSPRLSTAFTHRTPRAIHSRLCNVAEKGNKKDVQS